MQTNFLAISFSRVGIQSAAMSDLLLLVMRYMLVPCKKQFQAQLDPEVQCHQDSLSPSLLLKYAFFCFTPSWSALYYFDGEIAANNSTFASSQLQVQWKDVTFPDSSNKIPGPKLGHTLTPNQSLNVMIGLKPGEMQRRSWS